MSKNKYPIPSNEQERLQALKSYNILGTSPEEQLDKIVKLASYICQAPIALISFIDEKRQWFKANVGMDLKEVEREKTICQYTLMGDGLMVVPDAQEHDILKDHPHVAPQGSLRFYAGTPLKSPDGHNIGTFCVADTQPKELDQKQQEALEALAAQTMAYLDLRKQNQILQDDINQLADKALQNIAQELDYYKMAIDETSIVAITDANGIITYVNDKFCAISKYAREELLGQDLRLIDSNFHTKKFFEDLWKTILSGRVWKGEVRNQAKDGSFYWEDTLIVPFLDDLGKPYKFVTIKRDITRQKEEENKVDQFFNLSTDFLCIINSQGYFEKVSQTFSSALGYTEDELLSQPVLNFVLEEDLEATQRELEKLANGQPSVSFINRYRGKQGSVKLLSWNASPENESGYIYGTARDITENRKLDEENRRLSLVAKHTSNLVIITDKHSQIQWVNEAFEKITGYRFGEIEGQMLVEFLKQEGVEKNTRAQIKVALHNATPLLGEITITNKVGIKHYLQITLTPVFNDKQELINFIAVESDITEKKESHEKILNLIKTQRSIIDGASYSIIFIDENGIIKRINKSGLKLLGYKEHELVNHNTPLVFHDSDEVANHTARLTKETGLTFSSEFESLVYKAREEKVADSREWTYVTKSGQAIPVWQTITCIYDTGGQVQGYLSVAEDYTSKKIVESELIEAKKIAEQAVAMKDNFLANMSHEIRTPLNAIIGFTDLLSETPLAPKQKDFVNHVKTAGDNLLLIINDILDLSKIESGKLVIDSQPFNVRDTLKHVYDLLKVRADEKELEFNLMIDATLPDTLMGDKGRLNQIMVNLAGNAIKFTHQGEVTIHVKKLAAHAGTVKIRFSVKDTGIGIPDDKQQAIFDRFSQAEESTSRNFGGTGLGLNISKQLIELQQGQLQVKSELGKGSEFFFDLEYIMATSHLPDNEKKKRQPIPQQLSILLCEDNAINQRLATNVIEKFGFKVQIANNGQEGLALLADNSFDLILMDLQMPEMDGYQATQHIRQNLKSEIPIIAMTAHSLIGERQKCYDMGMNAYVPKPFKQDELLDSILSVLKASQDNKSKKPEQRSSSAASALDISLLREMSEGSFEFEKEIIELFCTRTFKDVLALESAIANQDFSAIRALAHGLRPSLALFKLDDLVGFLTKLENEAAAVLKQMATGLTDETQEEIPLFRNKMEASKQHLEGLLLSEYGEH